MNFEQRWEEAFKDIQEANNKKFGEFDIVMSAGFSELKPMFELFYKQGQEDVFDKLKVEAVDNINTKISFE